MPTNAGTGHLGCVLDAQPELDDRACLLSAGAHEPLKGTFVATPQHDGLDVLGLPQPADLEVADVDRPLEPCVAFDLKKANADVDRRISGRLDQALGLGIPGIGL